MNIAEEWLTWTADFWSGGDEKIWSDFWNGEQTMIDFWSGEQTVIDFWSGDQTDFVAVGIDSWTSGWEMTVCIYLNLWTWMPDSVFVAGVRRSDCLIGTGEEGFGWQIGWFLCDSFVLWTSATNCENVSSSSSF